MNRPELRQLAEDRIKDAEALLAAGRWSGAYYLAGYALECGLKSCVLKYIIESEAIAIFRNKKFAERCWTHDFSILVEQAELKLTRDLAGSTNPGFESNWQTVILWKETSRYEVRTSIQAQKLYDAICDPQDGVMQWVRANW